VKKLRPFRFGLETGGAASRQEWLDKARKMEDLGYSTVLLEDHLFCAFAPLAAMVSAAEVTSTLRIGTYVLGNDFRHPVVLAKEAATIDVLSNGRLELGIGTGYFKSDYERSGISLQPPGVRVERFKEAVQVMKGFFSGEPFSFEGQYYQVHDLDGLPQPVQKPHPPIMIGGGSKRILGFAAREADIVSLNIRRTPDGGFDFSSLTAEAAAQKIEWIRQAAGERFTDLELNLLVPEVAITDDRRQYAEKIHREWEMSDDAFTVDQLLDSPSFLIGSIEQIIEQLQMLREKLGVSYFSVWEPMEPFAPVVARLAGT
jgi:probable F420-dependent oxidoreductase